MDGSILEEKSSFKMLGLSFSSKLDLSSYIISIAKTAPMKIGTFIRSMKFVSSEAASFLYKSIYLFFSINLSYGLTWNTVVMPGLVLVAGAWKC